MLTRPEQHWRDRHVYCVDEPCFEVLADRRHATADLHVLSVSCGRGALQRVADTTRDKVKDGAAFHLDWRAGVMGQYEYRTVIRWVLPPPAAPGIVGPGTANRPEHVASHNPGADALSKPRCDIVIDAGGAAGLPSDALERARRDEPFMQRFTTDAERILARLARASTVAVERDRKVVHADLSHCCSHPSPDEAVPRGIAH